MLGMTLPVFLCILAISSIIALLVIFLKGQISKQHGYDYSELENIKNALVGGYGVRLDRSKVSNDLQFRGLLNEFRFHWPDVYSRMIYKQLIGDSDHSVEIQLFNPGFSIASEF